MKISEVIVAETITNVFRDTPDLQDKYRRSVWDILQSSYAAIGGIRGSGFSSPDDMSNLPMWKIFRKGDDVKAVLMYKSKSGRKLVALGTDGTPEGKAGLVNMIRDEFQTGRSYGEVSGPALKFITRVLGDEFVSQISIPFEQVKSILSDDWENEEIRQIDDFQYERLIGGKWSEKIMLGNPEAPSIHR